MVEAGGDVEQVRYLLLQVDEFGLEGAQPGAVGCGELVGATPVKMSRIRAVVGAA